MRSYIIFVVLSLALLMCSQAAPGAKKVTNDSSSSEESVEVNVKNNVKKSKHDDSSAESSEEVSGNDNTIKKMDQMINVSFKGLKKLHNGFNAVISDESVKKLHTEKMKNYVNNIKNFVDEFEQFEKKENRENVTFFHLLENAHDLLKSINTTNADNPAPEQVLLEVAMDKHGFKEQNATVPVDALQLMGDLSKYNTDNETTTLKKDTAEIDWREELKRSGDSAKKSESISKYLDMFAKFG